MNQRIVRDVSDLPTYGFSTQSGPWWGALGFVALEGTGFALAIALYLYLYATDPHWLRHTAPLNSLAWNGAHGAPRPERHPQSLDERGGAEGGSRANANCDGRNVAHCRGDAAVARL